MMYRRRIADESHQAARRVPTRRQASGQRPSDASLAVPAFILVAAVPVIVLSTWDGPQLVPPRANFSVRSATCVSRNLTSTITRYVTDVKAAFSLVFESGALQTPIPGLAHLLQSLDVVHVCVVAPDGTIEAGCRGFVRRRQASSIPRCLPHSRPSRPRRPVHPG